MKMNLALRVITTEDPRTVVGAPAPDRTEVSSFVVEVDLDRLVRLPMLDWSIKYTSLTRGRLRSTLITTIGQLSFILDYTIITL